MNRGDIRTAVRDDLDEASAAFWSDSLLNRYINRSLRWVHNRILSFDDAFFEKEVTVTYPGDTRETAFRTLDGAAFASDPDRIVMVEDISAGVNSPTVIDRIEKTDETSYQVQGESILDAQSSPIAGYYVTSIASGIAVDPGPATLAALGIRPVGGSRTLRITYVPAVDAIADGAGTDSVNPNLPLAFHEAVVLRTVILAKKREEAPTNDYEVELQRVLRDAINAVDGKGVRRTKVTDTNYYGYS